MPDVKQSPKPGRIYRVAHTQVGPFPSGHVFNEQEFKRLHPLPDNPATRDAGLHEQGADAYHSELLARLMDTGAIVPADPDNDRPAVTPLGPENRTAIPAKQGETSTTAPPPPAPAKA